jgi:hypothetical protein
MLRLRAQIARCICKRNQAINSAINIKEYNSALNNRSCDALPVLSVVRACVPNCYFLAHRAASWWVVFRCAARLRYHGFSEMQAFSLRYADYLPIISRAPAPVCGAYRPNKLYFNDSQKCFVLFTSNR